MQGDQLEITQFVLRNAIIKAITEQVPYLVLFEDKGMGSLVITKVEDLPKVLKLNPTLEYTHLCTVDADGTVTEPLPNEPKLKHQQK